MAGLTQIRRLLKAGQASERWAEILALLQAELLARGNDDRQISDLAEVEFRVFSQFGDDGILQYLTRRLAPSDTFAELGVSDYTEASTRLLLVKDNWRGLIVDASAKNMESVRASDLYWRHELTAVAEFIRADNVDQLLESNGISGDIGVLIIDIDGNDYWVWEAMTAVQPLIVGVEYNSIFGPDRSVAVPYNPSFSRGTAHASHLYWGASIGALTDLAERLGYRLVGSNSAGNNAYFVRADAVNGLPLPSAAEAWRESRFRESRDSTGRLTFLAGEARHRAVSGMPLMDIRTGEQLRVADLFSARS